MFEHDCLGTCCFGCLLCMCFVFWYLHLFSTIEHVSHGRVLLKYTHYYYYYYYYYYHYKATWPYVLTLFQSNYMLQGLSIVHNPNKSHLGCENRFLKKEDLANSEANFATCIVCIHTTTNATNMTMCKKMEKGWYLFFLHIINKLSFCVSTLGVKS